MKECALHHRENHHVLRTGVFNLLCFIFLYYVFCLKNVLIFMSVAQACAYIRIHHIHYMVYTHLRALYGIGHIPHVHEPGSILNTLENRN